MIDHPDFTASDGTGNTVYPAYTAAPLARELGIMFGFIGLSAITMGLYWIFWQAAQKRNATKEAARLEAIAARTRARAVAEKQPMRDVNNKDRILEERNNLNGSSGEARRLAWNETSASRVGLGELEEDLAI
ncbi:hypothetical protein D8B26_007884 [Coccidioides posadasii str. Silveira]|uniref:Uncharacterized protein n=2 Tax=Coccidioides posadasii TaxID=199306 RepID=E9D1L4_COCPS|nr:conserved hypothetical protein [Coccidioides posadasii str. Silveira]KMM72141.1 hypothetical protein CPAG_08440 [Coccidioides posadasii RMSCC 3488]QVM13271.1 hypothetical protein D8B26_007884 [Coccidioides posadasii str. Silveira]